MLRVSCRARKPFQYNHDMSSSKAFGPPQLRGLKCRRCPCGLCERVVCVNVGVATGGGTFAVLVQHVQCGDEELVGVLLLVAGQVAGVRPHQVQQAEGDVGRAVSRVELRRGGEEVIYIYIYI